MDDRRREWLEGRTDTLPSSVPVAESVRERRNTQQRARRARRASSSKRSSASADDLRERRNAQQRERRARQRAFAGGADDSSVLAGTSSSRERRNAQQRERRARLQQSHSGTSETGSDLEAVRVRTQRARRQHDVSTSRSQNIGIREDLSSRILAANTVTEAEIQWMAKSQQFLQDPRLALAYYHCCGVDPDSFVFGDERIAGEFDATRLRIAKLLEDCPGPSDIASCQRSVESLASEATSIWACASCGRVLLQNTAGQVYFASLDDLRPSVKLTDDELDKIYQSAPKAMVQRYRQLLYIGEEVFYLIPELVRDVKKIPLCQKCYTNPRSCKFSVASGHDYGRIGQLPSLNDVSLACITPTRCFGLELSLSGKHSSGHAICFPTNGPNVISRTLPNIDPECAPRVTFIGPMETWRIHKKKFLKLFEISADSVYKWLAVLARVNNVFIDEGIEIVDNPRRREFLRELEASIQSEVCIADSTVVSGLDQEAGSEFGERDNGCVSTAGMGTGDVFVRGSAVLPQVDQSDSAVVHEIIDAMVEAVGGDAGSVRQETPVIPIKRARSPFVEWEDNAKILATVFPNMFLTGSGPLPSGSLPRDYVDHFMHYWDGRFE
ncbi:hypothetical protein DVH05_027175, partial [Phytophthora capsici]